MWHVFGTPSAGCIMFVDGFILQIPLIDIDMMEPGFVSNKTPCAASESGNPQEEPSYPERDQRLSPMEQKHIDKITSLHSAFNFQQSRSLDHYFHRDLDESELQVVNSEQVLSRFIHHQQDKLKSRSKHRYANGGMETPRLRNGYPGLSRILKAFAPLRLSRHVTEDIQVENGPDESDIKPHPEHPRQQVLVVPQLWIWKIDSKFKSSFDFARQAIIDRWSLVVSRLQN